MKTRDPSDSAFTEPLRSTSAVKLHLALASILLAFFAPLVSWGLWLSERRSSPISRKLLGLAIVDTILIVGLVGTAALGRDLETTTRPPPRIGVALDARDQGEGAVVERVAPGSPAAAASIRPGDRAVAVDGLPIEHNQELVTAISRTPKGTERRITLVRDGERVVVKVTPSASLAKPEPSSRSLFEPIEAEGHALRPGRLSGWAGVVELALVGTLVIAARRRGAPTAPGLAVLAGLLALVAASSAVVWVFIATVGLSLGAVLVAILSGTTALLVTGLLALRLLPPEPVQIGPPMPTAKAVLLGLFYAVTGSVRVGIFVALLVAALGLPMTTASEAFALDLSWGPLGVGLFLLATVVLAPLAEETLFRGVLLPWLAGWMASSAALVWSTVVFAMGHLYYGVGVLLIAFYGYLFGWARLRTGSLRAPIVLHALLNGTTAAALLAASR